MASVKAALAKQVVSTLGELVVEQIGGGHAGALSALRVAYERIAQGQDDLCLFGGADSYLDAGTIAWLDAQRQLARSGIRAGFTPGEGAVVVALASSHGLRELGMPSLGRVLAVACTEERRNRLGDEGLFGEALSAAVLKATDNLQLPEQVVSDVYCDINGERPRTEDWGFALMRTAGRFRDGSAYVTAVGECGDIGAASGALGCVLAIQAWRRRYASGPRALVWATSWRGLRGAALLAQEAA